MSGVNFGGFNYSFISGTKHNNAPITTITGTLLLMGGIVFNICVVGMLFRPHSFYLRRHAHKQRMRELKRGTSNFALDCDELQTNYELVLRLYSYIKHSHIYTHSQTHSHTYPHTYPHTHTYTYTYTYIYIYISLYVYIYIYVYYFVVEFHFQYMFSIIVIYNLYQIRIKFSTKR